MIPSSPSRSPLRAACALLLLAVVVTAQDQPPAEPSPAPPPAPSPAPADPAAPAPGPGSDQPDVQTQREELRVDRPATVNGEAITSDEIVTEALRMAQDRPGADPVALQRRARALIAGQILLAAEARRLGVTLPDRDLDGYWERATGRVPDYEALAAEAGVSVDRQKELMRRVALADLYLRHRIGLRGDYGRWIAPDPRLVRLVTVTPSQMRETFREMRPLLDRPERVLCDLYPCADEAAALTTEQVLAAGGVPPGQPPAKREVPLDDVDPEMPPELAAFLREGTVGSMTRSPADQGVLLVVITGRAPAQQAEFETAQENLRLMMMRDRMELARLELIEALSRQATYWPRDLFDA